tara:strand:- start:474 stop:704 length:231 start_codon:yes stop_codon:yes gene_type:complete
MSSPGSRLWVYGSSKKAINQLVSDDVPVKGEWDDTGALEDLVDVDFGTTVVVWAELDAVGQKIARRVGVWKNDALV